MSQHTDHDSADFDPLLLFTNEPELPAVPTAPTQIPKEIEPAPPSPDLAAMLRRAETAERSLRESRRELAALKHETATLVSASKDNRVRARRSAVALGLAAACLFAAVAVYWPQVPAEAPAIVVAQEAAASEPVAQPAATDEPITPTPPVPVTPTTASGPYVSVAATAPLPVRNVRARSQEQLEPQPQPRREYVGTLSVDAVPAGGEVFINRKSVGKTPALLSGLRAGSHLVWIEREGYRRFTRVVTVPADKVSRVSVALEPVNTVAPRP